MVFTNDNAKKVLVQCDRGIETLAFEKFGSGCFLSILLEAFYSEQDTVIDKIKNRIKMAWFILRGKGYRLMEIYLPEEGLKELKEAINSMD